MAELTVYPDPDPESDSIDGHVNNRNVSWSTCRSAATGFDLLDNHTELFCLAQEVDGDDEYRISRVFTTFDTSPLGVGATISAATLSLRGSSEQGTVTIHCVESTQASNNALTTADFDQAGTTSFANVSSWSDVAYNDFTLSAAGRAIIDLTGVSLYAIREGHDNDNSEPSVAEIFSATCFSADEAGTTKDPKLVITFTPPAPASGFFALLV
ncbi:hypothetical protein LCGC14_2847100 [marine sediment metagenome]|uniref:Uncharacterized protein n=1 Tax=marine sediment metagenome TaxID=412755 RepID=A0A0F8Y9J6_9ZZZZ